MTISRYQRTNRLILIISASLLLSNVPATRRRVNIKERTVSFFHIQVATANGEISGMGTS